MLQYGHVDAAVAYLHYLYSFGYNEGKATTGDLSVKGLTYKNVGEWDKLPFGAKHSEIMQLDATLGALNAIMEILVQNRDETISILPNIPKGWKNFSFNNVLAEGAFWISAQVRNGSVEKIKVISKKGGLLRLDHHLGNCFLYKNRKMYEPIFEKVCKKGEIIEIEKN